MVAVNHLKKARGEIWPKRSERRNNTKTTKMGTKSPQLIKINTQFKKPHLKMIPIKDNYKTRYGPDYRRPDKENK